MSESVAETADAAENEEQADDSMEKLEFDEEDEKMVSAEDLLGGKSLMMSDDSENEDLSTLKPRKISPKARRQRMINSDQEDQEEDAVEAGNLDQKQEEHISPKNKGQRLLDSDEEEEEVFTKSKKKKSAVISSDSEEEQPVAKEKPVKKGKKKTSQVDEEREDQEQEKPAKTEKKKRVTKNKKKLQENQQEDDQEQPPKKEKSKKSEKNKKQMAKLSESQVDKEEGSQMDQEGDQEQEKPVKTQKPKKLTKKKKQQEDTKEEETNLEQKKLPQKSKAKKLAKAKKESQMDKEESPQMEMDEESKMDQEEDQEQENPPIKQKPKKKTKKNNQKVDSEEESQLETDQKDLEHDKPSEKIKIYKLDTIDDEDREETDQPKKVAKKNKQTIESDEESEENKDEEMQDQDVKKMDSENEPQNNSDDDEDVQEPPKKAKKNKQRMNSDSEEEIQKNQSEEAPSSPKNKLKGLVDSESEPEESTGEISPAKNKLKGLVDSESEAELSNPEESLGEQEAPTEVTKGKPKKPKVVRESAKKALEGMQAIQSEQQRLHREAHINVPYHQPKPRTLKEFLSRRTINAPLATALAGGSPMPIKQPRKPVGLRMTREELEAYAKLMEDRAKEATEFFKSESEPEDQEDSDNEEPMELKDNPGVLDEVLDNPKTPEKPKEHIDELTSEAMENPDIQEAIVEDPIIEEEPIASTSAAAALRFTDNFEVQPESEAKSPSKVCLVTEVVELPRLDLSTINITPPSKPATPKISEAIRRLKIEKSSDVSPSLKGDANMVIDLETGDMFTKKPTGVDDLLKRLMKTREAKKHKTTETVNILTTEHGKLEMSKVSIHLHEEEINKDPKPGAGYIKMQEQLKSLITKKRMEDLRKKQAEEQEKMAEDEEEVMDVDEEYEPEDKPGYAEVTINEDEEIVEETEGTAEEDEEVEETEADEKAENDPVEDLEEEDNSSESEQESEPEPEPETQTGRKKNRIIKAFEDDNSDEDDLDLLQTPKPSNVAPITATQLQLSAHKLFDAETRRTASDEENELLDLCSGQFPQSQMLSSAAPSVDPAVISQIPMTQFGGSSQAPDELEGLCSGTFATQLPSEIPTQQPEEQEESHEPPVVANRILSSDEEEAKEDATEADKPRNKKLTKKRPKKKAKLGFSDDEESDGDVEEFEEFEEECDEEPVEEIPETFVDYDSEENEIVVEMTKKDRKVRAANFVDKEAELSESEWGSADEDEKNMDNYDIELGDEDQFDRDKLRNELGQIHARKMMDQDIREVRKIKEMLFEEEEEGASRQRQFRWKNVENGFSLDDRRPENGEGNEGSGDEENEHLWRKIRYEREQLLLEKGLKTEAASPLSTSVINTSTPGNSIRRLNIISSKKTTVEVKKSSPFLISKTVAGKQQKSAVRGSFLVRDQQTLTKLAGLTKGTSGDIDGAEGTISVKTAKAKNFVFATLTEEEHENRKRKAADLLNSSTETGVNFMKKPRLEPRREKCLIDQLL
ncbi:claspin [Drosophila subpulchrella]|uniref:claspin n=1 Tax=Drosophila subpulchrella TaxID=1486046 RepID=UPI0018A14525|nr:claspin [Drosophila subpulchrella]